MAFPLPKLLPRIEELLQEVQWLDGLILITDSDRACFVSFSQVDPLLRRLRQRPKGPEVAEKLCMSLLDCHGKGGAKPVLVFQGCLLYTSPSPRDRTRSRMPSSA